MNQQRGNILFNTLLVVLCAVIAVLIYMLAGGPMPGEKKSVGVASPQMDISDSGTDVSTNDTYAGEFSDGLGVPDSAQEFALDEFGAGISERDVFNRDINNDGRIDRITRTRNVQNAGRILVLDEQGICEEGTHQQLLAQGGVYASLYHGS